MPFLVLRLRSRTIFNQRAILYSSESTPESLLLFRPKKQCYITAKECSMNGTNQERWLNLCEQAKREQDPQKLSGLFAKIDGMLQEKQDRLNGPMDRIARRFQSEADWDNL